MLPIGAAFAAYDLFEDALELALDPLTYFFVTIADADSAPSLRINLECAADLSALARHDPDVLLEQDEDGWFLTRPLTPGGDRA